jgi:hypothetical protein
LRRCGDGLFFEVPPLAASGALLKKLHPRLEYVLQTVCRKLQEDSGTGAFYLFITSKFFLKRFQYLKTAARSIASFP